MFKFFKSVENVWMGLFTIFFSSVFESALEKEYENFPFDFPEVEFYISVFFLPWSKRRKSMEIPTKVISYSWPLRFAPSNRNCIPPVWPVDDTKLKKQLYWADFPEWEKNIFQMHENINDSNQFQTLSKNLESRNKTSSSPTIFRNHQLKSHH